MPPLDCTDIKALLSALIDDQLDPHTRHQVERHLAQCEQCCAQINEHERLDALVAMSAELSLHAQPDLPRGFEDEVLARTVRAAPAGATHFQRAVSWTGWMAAAASIALAAYIWMLDQRGTRPSEVAAAESSAGTSDAARPSIRAREATAHAQEEPAAREVREPHYATGSDLQSSVFEGPFDLADALRARQPVLGNPVYAPALDEFTSLPARSVEIGEQPRALAVTNGAMNDPVEIALRDAGTDADSGLRPAPAISRDEADAIYNVSLLMRMLAEADLTTFADVDQVRRVVLADDLIDRLSEAREGLDAADRPVVLAAEAVLVRVVEGPLDQEDVRHLRETVARLDLPAEVGSITARWDDAHSM